jgi:hypothetical protein
MMGHGMPSLIETRIAEREAFLARYRKTYLVSICHESGHAVDLREAALREAVAMIEVATDLLPRDKPIAATPPPPHSNRPEPYQ